jgi:hypothetical protein
MDDEDIAMARIAENIFRKPVKSVGEYHKFLREWYDFHKKKTEGLSDQQLAAKERARKEGGKFTAKEAGDDEPSTFPRNGIVDEAHEEEQKPEPAAQTFADQVAAATGQKKSAAYKDIKIIKEFTEEELDCLRALGVTDNQLIEISKLPTAADRNIVMGELAIGTAFQDAIEAGKKSVEARAGRKADSKAGAEKKASEMTDEEWLSAIPLRSKLDDPSVFDRAAKMYRSATNSLNVLRLDLKQGGGA